MLLGSSLAAAEIVEFSPGLLTYVSSRWGHRALDRLQKWRAAELERMRARQDGGSSEALSLEDLQVFNALWNKVPFHDDLSHWGVADYWATPVEMLSSNGGDCEDYSIAKYFSLKDIGIPVEKLRITYVRALKINEPHMVLAYYPTPDADPYILDNLSARVLPASKRQDLEPVYSFNDEDLWAAGVQAPAKGQSSQIRLWSELLKKMDKEREM